MATVPTFSLSRRAVMRVGLLAFPLVAALSVGCVTTNDMLLWKTEKTPTEPVCQALCMWQNSVQYAPDPTRGGAPGVGLACRLYLFGQKADYPIRAEGSLVVDLLDETDGKSVHQEQWRFDPETVKKLVSKDFVGTGYTLFLPWSRYRPETSKVRLRVGFFAASGVAPIYTENAITLAEENGVIRDMNSPIGGMSGQMGVNESQPMRSPTLSAPTPLK